MSAWSVSSAGMAPKEKNTVAGREMLEYTSTATFTAAMSTLM
jgi:hypothetical protein